MERRFEIPEDAAGKPSSAGFGESIERLHSNWSHSTGHPKP